MAKPKRPRDFSQRAKLIVDLATGEATEKKEPKVVVGRAGGLKGGNARAQKLTAAERKAIAEKAAKKRWGR